MYAPFQYLWLVPDRGLLAGEIKPGLDHRVGQAINVFGGVRGPPLGEGFVGIRIR